MINIKKINFFDKHHQHLIDPAIKDDIIYLGSIYPDSFINLFIDEKIVKVEFTVTSNEQKQIYGYKFLSSKKLKEKYILTYIKQG